MQVVEVSKTDLMKLAGRPWIEVLADVATQQFEAKLEDVVYQGVFKPPQDTAWLREIDKRAYLYRQGW